MRQVTGVILVTLAIGPPLDELACTDLLPTHSPNGREVFDFAILAMTRYRPASDSGATTEVRPPASALVSQDEAAAAPAPG